MWARLELQWLSVVKTFTTFGGIACLTWVCREAVSNSTTASLAYLLLVLLLATKWGLRQAILASVCAALCLNVFFLPPVGTLNIADPQNWIALGVFLTTAVIASELSDGLRKQRTAALKQRLEVERLYTLSRSVLLDTNVAPLGSVIVRHIADIFGFSAVVLYDLQAERRFAAGLEELELSSEQLGTEYLTRLPDDSQAVPVRLGNKRVGVLFVKGAIEEPALEAVANLVAVNLAKAASQELSNQASVARKNEELKSSILDALAHEFKTPLTSIKAACTSLLADPGAHMEQVHELLSIVNEETDRLTGLVNEAIQVSRIEAGKVRLTKAPASIREIVHAVLTQMKSRFEDRAVGVDLGSDLPFVLVDRDLIELAIRQVVDNALKYSPPGSPILLRADATVDRVRISVQDAGPGISLLDQQKVFEKFYRGESIRDRLPGSGVGLSIVKEILKAHFGGVRVESVPGQGAIFIMELPFAAEAKV